jgi:hypothetical protein
MSFGFCSVVDNYHVVFYSVVCDIFILGVEVMV